MAVSTVYTWTWRTIPHPRTGKGGSEKIIKKGGSKGDDGEPSPRQPPSGGVRAVSHGVLQGGSLGAGGACAVIPLPSADAGTPFRQQRRMLAGAGLLGNRVRLETRQAAAVRSSAATPTLIKLTT